MVFMLYGAPKSAAFARAGQDAKHAADIVTFNDSAPPAPPDKHIKR